MYLLFLRLHFYSPKIVIFFFNQRKLKYFVKYFGLCRNSIIYIYMPRCVLYYRLRDNLAFDKQLFYKYSFHLCDCVSHLIDQRSYQKCQDTLIRFNFNFNYKEFI